MIFDYFHRSSTGVSVQMPMIDELHHDDGQLRHLYPIDPPKYINVIKFYFHLLEQEHFEFHLPRYSTPDTDRTCSNAFMDILVRLRELRQHLSVSSFASEFRFCHVFLLFLLRNLNVVVGDF